MSKTLIVYYSYAGHSKMIAEKVQKKLNCDMVELQPVNAYPDDYQYVVDMSEAKTDKQYINPELKPLEVDLKEYDKIVLLYGVWWYGPSAPIITFLEENDLSGKTIVPCSTNAGWLGHSLKDIEKMCPNSNVVNGISIKFGMDHTTNEILTPEKEIDEWIEKI